MSIPRQALQVEHARELARPMAGIYSLLSALSLPKRFFEVAQEADFGGQSVPVGGFAYYISPPSSAGAPAAGIGTPTSPRSALAASSLHKREVSNIWEDPLHAPWQKDWAGGGNRGRGSVPPKLMTCRLEEACFGAFRF